MKKFWKYIITAVAGAIMALLILLSRGTFYKTDIAAVYLDLCDAFFVPGVIIVGMGALVFATNGGTFDMLAYGVIKLFDLFKKDLTKVKYRTFNDYRSAQMEKQRSFGYLLIVGVAYILVGVVFLVLEAGAT